jgi:hypothetical protein
MMGGIVQEGEGEVQVQDDGWSGCLLQVYLTYPLVLFLAGIVVVVAVIVGDHLVIRRIIMVMVNMALTHSPTHSSSSSPLPQPQRQSSRRHQNKQTTTMTPKRRDHVQ